MAKIKITLVGIEKFETKLQRHNPGMFLALQEKQITQIFNRIITCTPVDTGELRLSRGRGRVDVGYHAEYAPHVEYGHRLKNGGYVQGQRFFKENIDRQREIYRTDLQRALKQL